MQLLFLCYQSIFYMGFTFTTTKCSLQLTQHILTLRARRSLRTTNFIVCECRFANYFFCKIGTGGSLIHLWYCWKMFAAHFYAGCFDSGKIQLGKKNLWLNWEKAIYRPLFALANILLYSKVVLIHKKQSKLLYSNHQPI